MAEADTIDHDEDLDFEYRNEVEALDVLLAGASEKRLGLVRFRKLLERMKEVRAGIELLLEEP